MLLKFKTGTPFKVHFFHKSTFIWIEINYLCLFGNTFCRILTILNKKIEMWRLTLKNDAEEVGLVLPKEAVKH